MGHRQLLRVKRDPEPKVFVGPQPLFKTTIFVEPDGTENTVTYSGKHMPTVSIPRSEPRWRTIGHPVWKP